MFSTIRSRIIIPLILIIVASTLTLTLVISKAVTEARSADLEERLLSEAYLIGREIAPYFSSSGTAQLHLLRTIAADYALISDERITVINAEGVVLADSHADPATMGNHLYREEIAQAKAHGEGIDQRYSTTTQQDTMYVAVKVDNGTDYGFVRLALVLEDIENSVGALRRTIITSGAVIALLSVLLSTYVAARTTRPIEQLTEVVERVTDGDMNARLLPTSRDEFGQLTRAFNHMADELREKITSLARERSRLGAVLDNMADGVLITDETGKVILINTAAQRILRTAEERALGRTFAQVAYNHQLINLWNACVHTGEEQTETVETMLYGNFLQVVISELPDSAPSRYLVMLQDLTHIRRLETIRRDFISNISHELRTPLASLSLVVETLSDGAIDDPPAARRFLSHMETELASLTQMVEELLELSRIESGRVPLNIKATSPRKLVQKPVKRLKPLAERKGVDLNVNVPDDLPRVSADAKRIHQVVTNLVHNAVKFTDTGGMVTVFASEYQEAGEDTAKYVLFGVTDTGTGIPDEALPRIFERFYKTDRARSEEGTGLGLAIAKHIVQGHEGRIWVESIEGVGSTFRFILPIAGSSVDLDVD